MDKDQLMGLFNAIDSVLERLGDNDRVGAHQSAVEAWDIVVSELGHVPNSQTGLTYRCDACGTPVDDGVELCSYCS